MVKIFANRQNANGSVRFKDARVCSVPACSGVTSATPAAQAWRMHLIIAVTTEGEFTDTDGVAFTCHLCLNTNTTILPEIVREGSR